MRGSTGPSNGQSRIVIAGAGYVGMYAALRLQRKLRRSIEAGKTHITLVNPESYMTYQPFLPETAAGSLEPRHVVVNLRRLLRRCTVLNGRIMHISHANRALRVESVADEVQELQYDTLIVALGSISRTLPIPGLAEQGIGIKTVGEAVYLRNHVLNCLDVAAAITDGQQQQRQRRALTYVVIGGGYAGIETLAELENLSKAAIADYPGLRADQLRWVLVEASGRILPEVGVDMGKRTVQMLTKRGIEIHLNTTMESAVGGHVVLSNGVEFDTDTLIWTAGVKANPVLANSDLPLDDKGRLIVDATLAVPGCGGVWSAGDCAAVPDLTQPGQFCTPSAQHAIRQGKLLADNILAVDRGRPAREYRHKYAGSVAGLGLHQGVAQIYGVKLRGWLAWFVHRTYHAAMMPTINRKVRVIADWTLALFSRRDAISLGELHAPRAEFERASSEGTSGKSAH